MSCESPPINPYAAPEGSGDRIATPQDMLSPADQRCLRVGRVMVTWEKLRALYNLILGAEAMALVAGVVPAGRTGRGLIKQIVGGALVANLLFCAGPLVDGYLSWLGLRSRWVTGLLFIMGTCFAMLLGVVFLGPIGAMMDEF